ncbi:lantibiotic dehydratase [Actinomadura sp. SCN-SB]|uniref:lantibiotic dehydratase n=1 Tax=Actinomadura sp. SCN-SB TaxID=3373092 RepID=UPI0037505FC6
MGARRLYKPAGVVLARIGTDPGDLEVPSEFDFFDDAALRGPALEWLRSVWESPAVRVALNLASPAFAEQVEQVITDGVGDRANDARLRRLLLTLGAYLLRWQRRTTPFGVFAGITTVNVGTKAHAALGSADRLTLHADAQWLHSLIDRIERHPELLRRLTVVANNAGEVRGGRFVVPGRPSSGSEAGPLVEVSVRCTRAVQAVLAAAAHPIVFAELHASLGEQFPGVPSASIETLLTELVEQGVLLTGLRPPATVVDGLEYLLGRLRAAEADRVPDLASVLAELTEVHAELIAHARSQPVPVTVRGFTRRMRAICGQSSYTLAADTEVDAEITLPSGVLDEAARAVEALVRLSPHRFGTEAWRDFHVQFRGRYGPGAMVPVRELVSDSGLGFPAGYLGASRGRAARQPTDRDVELLTLVQRAAVDGRREIELTDDDIAALTVGGQDEMVAPQRVELAFQVLTDSIEALQRGRFRLWVTGAPRVQSSMAGRFTHLLPASARELLASSYTAASSSDDLVAQLSFPPRRAHNGNVVRVQPLLPAVISIGEHPDSLAEPPHAQPISLDELAVTADATHMYLVHQPTGQRVQPWALHALEASVHTPPLARFLAEVATARCAVYGPFDFGIARTLPHLPSVRYGRSVLSPARWILSASELPDPQDSVQAWEKALAAWCDRWNAPSHLTLIQGDRRLPLDLDQGLDRTLLRTRLEVAGKVELQEAPAPSETAWIGRPCEFLTPFTTTSSASLTSRQRITITAARPLAPVSLPGRGTVLHARLLGHHSRYNEILTAHLPALIASLGADVLRWWFRRHRDTTRPDTVQELWLYLRLRNSHAYGSAAACLADFGVGLHAQGLLADLVLASYRPQSGRYGPVDAAEQVAATDSAAAIAQINMAAQADLPSQAITAASMADLAAALAPSPRTGSQWLVDQLPQGSGKLDQHIRDTALLLSGTDSETVLASLPSGEATAAAWRERCLALRSYQEQLIAERGEDDAAAVVLKTLLHDHYVRSLGVDPERERTTNRFARAAALRDLALSKAAAP